MSFKYNKSITIIFNKQRVQAKNTCKIYFSAGVERGEPSGNFLVASLSAASSWLDNLLANCRHFSASVEFFWLIWWRFSSPRAQHRLSRVL